MKPGPKPLVNQQTHCKYTDKEDHFVESQAFGLHYFSFDVNMVLMSPNGLLESTKKWKLIWWIPTITASSTVVHFLN